MAATATTATTAAETQQQQQRQQQRQQQQQHMSVTAWALDVGLCSPPRSITNAKLMKTTAYCHCGMQTSHHHDILGWFHVASPVLWTLACAVRIRALGVMPSPKVARQQCNKSSKAAMPNRQAAKQPSRLPGEPALHDLTGCQESALPAQLKIRKCPSPSQMHILP